MHVPPESLTALQRTQVEGLEVPAEVDPSVSNCVVQMARPTLDDLRGDDERLCEALAAEHGIAAAIPDLEVARLASTELRRLGWQARVTLRGSEVIHVAAVDAPWLGLAVDIGTTKIAAYVVDLASGQTLAARGVMNPQIAYGEDVIARLVYAGKGPDEAARLQALLADGLSQLAADACAEIGAQASRHRRRRRRRQHGHPPSVPAAAGAAAGAGALRARGARRGGRKARDIGVRLAPGARVHLLPNIAGYVGADHVAMLLATGVADLRPTRSWPSTSAPTPRCAWPTAGR